MIEKFASKFGLHPDEVYSTTEFDTLIAFLVKWKEESEVSEKIYELEKMMTEGTSK
jgi:hypothetical protein